MFDISISPSNNQFFIKPGQSYLLALEILNNSKTTLSLNSSVEPWLPKGKQGEISYNNVFPDTSISFSLNNADLKLGQTFLLKPNEKKQLVLKISSSTTNNPKDHFYTFFVSQISPNQTTAKIGAHLIFSTQEKQDTSLSIKNFSISPFIKDTFLKPITFSGEIYNNSTQYNKSIGQITITKNELKIKELILSPDTILGKNSRLIRCMDTETNIVPCTINPPFWPGKYQATLTLNSQKPVSLETGFFIFPYSFFLLSGIILAILLFLYRRLSRR
jgi:hypothetical protein